jgi:tetratricopeptide (TPR) repeat protein
MIHSPARILSLALPFALGGCGAADSTPTPEKVPASALPPPQTEPEAKKADTKAPAPPKTPKAPTIPTYDGELATMDKTIASTLARAEKVPKSYLVLEQAAGMHLSRARLSGDWNDYARAEEILEKAFTVREGIGPYAARARFNYTMHRLDRIDADLAKLEKRPAELVADGEEAGLVTLRGEIAFQRGDYDTAEKRYDEALKLDPDNAGALTAKATFLWKTGAFDEAEALYDRVEAAYHGKSAEPRAWYRLMHGLLDLDRGRYDEALAHYREAEAQLSGWWLVDEHVAEILTLTGKTEEAKALYLDVIERTGNPEFLDAMAGILKEEGKTDEAAEYVKKARAVYEEQLAKYPEAAYGHALGHFLETGDDPARALDLAEKNYALRGNGDAATKLAEAHLLAGDAKAAGKLVDKTLKTRWKSADLHVTAASVYEALGRADDAAAQKAAALAINPRAFD